jgi:hypothetical protein
LKQLNHAGNLEISSSPRQPGSKAFFPPRRESSARPPSAGLQLSPQKNWRATAAIASF